MGTKYKDKVKARANLSPRLKRLTKYKLPPMDQRKIHPNRKAEKKSNARLAEFDRMTAKMSGDRKQAFTRPGSRNPHKQA